MKTNKHTHTLVHGYSLQYHSMLKVETTQMFNGWIDGWNVAYPCHETYSAIRTNEVLLHVRNEQFEC